MPKRKQASAKDETSPTTVKKKKDGAASKKRRTQSPRFSKKRLQQWYQSYKDPEENCIGPNGIERFCQDLGVDPEDVVLLVISWHLNAARMGYFAEEEFMRFEALQVDSTDKLQDKLDVLRSELANPTTVRDIYQWSFVFAKEQEQKTLDVETASGLVALLLHDRPHAVGFAEFITQQTAYKVINKDQWTTFLDFSESIQDNFSNYDENAAWPVLFDDFVNWAKKRNE